MFLNRLLGIDFFDKPEYQERHLFVAKLRLYIFTLFWTSYIYLTRDIIKYAWPVVLVICLSFLLTILVYITIKKGKLFVFALWIQLFADAIVLTAVIYITGGPYSPFFTIYIIYCLLAGLFYHYKFAIVAGVFCSIFYAMFLLLCQEGYIEPLNIHFSRTFPANPSPSTRLVLLILAMVVSGYALKISGFFQKRREHALEARNKELAALHRLSSTIRRAISLSSVIDQLLFGVLESLDIKMAMLFIFDEEEQIVKFYTPKHHPKKSKYDSVITKHSDGLKITWDILSQPAFADLHRGRIIYRKNLNEFLFSLQSMEKLSETHDFKKMFGEGRVVGIPLMSANRVLGALVCLTSNPFADEKMVQRLEAFANQAALFIEAATLIERLKISNEKLEVASKAKSEFLAMMGHELRTPLTAIIGFSEVLLEGVMGKLADEQKDCLEEVVRNGRDLLSMINGLLDLSKSEAGKISLELETVNWKQLTDEVRRTIKPLSDNKKIMLNIHIPNDVPNTMVDGKKFRQVLINLFSNAIKFTPNAGQINVKLSYFKNYDELPLNYRDKFKKGYSTGAVSFVIEDSGIGIEEKQLEEIFEPFHQADTSITRAFGGTGLGLSLAKQFVELHEGVIWAENTKEQGARFTILIPDKKQS